MGLWIGGAIALAVVIALVAVMIALTHFDRVRGARALKKLRDDEARWKEAEERRRALLAGEAHRRYEADLQRAMNYETTEAEKQGKQRRVFEVYQFPVYPIEEALTPRRQDDELTDRPGRFETGGGFGGDRGSYRTGGGFGGDSDRFDTGGGFGSSGSSSGSSDSSSSSSSSSSSD